MSRESSGCGCSTSIGLGSVLGVVTSWALNNSFWWAVFHFFCGWIYVLYVVFCRTKEIIPAFKQMFLGLILITGIVSMVGCDRTVYVNQGQQGYAPQQAAPQVSQQEILKGVIQDYLTQASPGTQVLGANFLPLTDHLYIAKTDLQAGGLSLKKDFTVESVGDPSNPQWQVQPVTDVTLRETLARYNMINEIDAIYHHPSYHTASMMDALLRWHYIYGRPAPLYWGHSAYHGYDCWGFVPQPYYRTYYSTVITRYPRTYVSTGYLAPRVGISVYRPRTVVNNITVNKTTVVNNNRPVVNKPTTVYTPPSKPSYPSPYSRPASSSSSFSRPSSSSSSSRSSSSSSRRR